MGVPSGQWSIIGFQASAPNALQTAIVPFGPGFYGATALLVIVGFQGAGGTAGAVQIRVLDALGKVLASVPAAAPGVGTNAIVFTIGLPEPIAGNDRDSGVLQGSNGSANLGIPTPLAQLAHPLSIEVGAAGAGVTSKVQFLIRAGPIA